MTVPPLAPDRETRTQALLESFEERILVLDGATGTALQAYELSAADFGGAELEGCNENLCRTRPDVVRGISEGYLAAGADVVETNSFGATPLVLAEYGLRLSGQSPDGGLVELIELPDHPWFIGCQFHPELKSRPTRPHPLFAGFIGAALARRQAVASPAKGKVNLAEASR